MIIVATPQVSIPAVDLLVDAMPAGTAKVTIWRSFGAERSVVRDANQTPTGGAVSRPFADFEVPLSTATSYQVYAYSSAGAVLGSAQSDLVTVDASSPWISDPLAPGRACAVALINESLQEITHNVPGDIAQVADSGLPIAVMGTVGVASEVPIRFAAPTELDGLSIRTVLHSANPFLLRVPPVAKVQLPSMAYIAFQSYSDVRNSRTGRGHDHISLSGVVVAPPISPVVLAVRTYGDLRDEASTYGDVTAMYSTYLDVLRGS